VIELFDGDFASHLDKLVYAGSVMMLWMEKRKFMQGLQARRWSRILSNVMDVAPPDGYCRMFDSMISWIRTCHRAICDSVVVEVICRGLTDTPVENRAFDNYHLYLTDEFVCKIIKTLPPDASNKREVLQEFVDNLWHRLRFVSLERHLEGVVGNDLLKVEVGLYSIAMVINPEVYVNEFIRRIEIEPPEKMKSWLGFEGKDLCNVTQALTNLQDASPAAKMLCWMSSNYDVESFESIQIVGQEGITEEYWLAYAYEILWNHLSVESPECAIAIIDEALKSRPNPHLSNLRMLIAEKVARRSPPRKIHGDELYALCVANADKSATKNKGVLPKKKRAERKSKVEQRERLTEFLKERAFAMLGLEYVARQELMDGLTGRYLHIQTGIRESTIGSMIDLKATFRSGKKELNTLLQLLYLVCKNDAVYNFFEEYVKKSKQVWRSKSNEELYHLLKNILEQTLKRHLHPE